MEEHITTKHETNLLLVRVVKELTRKLSMLTDEVLEMRNNSVVIEKEFYLLLKQNHAKEDKTTNKTFSDVLKTIKLLKRTI